MPCQSGVICLKKPPGLEARAAASDAASLISAGIGLCFMTQMGRYSGMTKKPLEKLRNHTGHAFLPWGASHGTGQAGTAQPVETHVYIKSDLQDDVAQDILGIGERTCFLHAFCRDDLRQRCSVRTDHAA